MAQHILPRAPTSKKLLTALRSAFGPIPVGDAAAARVGNAANGAVAPLPYAVLLPLWSNLDGPAWSQDRHADAEWIYQIDLYAERGDQLEGMRDKAFAAVLGKTETGYATDLNTDDAKIIERSLADDTGVGDPVGSTLPSQLRFRLHATPADTAPPP